MPWGLIDLAILFVAFGVLAKLTPCNPGQPAFLRRELADDALAEDDDLAPLRSGEVRRLVQGLGEARARRAFQDIARLTRGAYMSFDSASAQALRDLLKAVAVYAAGGPKALKHYAEKHGGEVLRLTAQLA